MEIVSFEIAKKLKEKGFNYECFGHYFDNEFHTDMPPKYYQREKYVSAPTISQVLKWLRKERGLFVQIMFVDKSSYYYEVIDVDTAKVKCSSGDYKKSPELASLAGIEYVIDNLI